MKRMEFCFKQCKAENRAALVVYVTVGCPTMAESEVLIDRLIEAGVDIIELGVPFSDPMADGPVIQHAGQIALEAGCLFPDILALAGRIRKRHPETPLVLFSYYNVLFSYGLDRLGLAMNEAGIDGLLAVDLPLEERGEILPLCQKHDIDLIPLVSPATSLERAKKIVADCGGFVYAITLRGVTGVRSELPPELAGELETLRRNLPLPIGAGFGISTPDMARTVGSHADAVVVGSAVMKRVIEEGTDSAVQLTREISLALA